MRKAPLFWCVHGIVLGLTACAAAAGMGGRTGKFAIVNGTLIDGTGASPLPEAVVLIDGDRITAVGSGAALAVPAGFRRIDARRGVILPGFINAHVHAGYREDAYRAWARAGVTTVRELMSYPPDTTFAMRDRINRDPRNARMVAAGPQMTAPDGFAPAPRYSLFIRSREEGVRQAERVLDEGADLVKVMMESNWGFPSLPVETARAIVETAHRRGKRASMHVSLSRDAAKALVVGCDDLAHMVIDELPPELAKQIAAAGIIWVPTMEVWKGNRVGGFVGHNLRVFAAAGGKVALGTDYGGDDFEFEMGMPLKELGWMQEAGLTPLQVIVASTRNAAEACGLAEETGTVKAGKLADLIIVPGDPLADLAVLKKVWWVMRGGVVIRSDE